MNKKLLILIGLMAMAYTQFAFAINNLTNLTNAQNIYDIIVYDNKVTSGLASGMFMIAVFVILLLSFFRKYTFEESLLTSSFLTAVFSVFLRAIGLISFNYVVTFGIMLAASGFWVYISKKT